LLEELGKQDWPPEPPRFRRTVQVLVRIGGADVASMLEALALAGIREAKVASQRHGLRENRSAR
jgi:hypothetical protein